MLSCWCVYCSSLPEEPQPSIRWMLNAPVPEGFSFSPPLSSPNPFRFCSSSSDFNKQKGINRSESVLLLSVWGAHARGKRPVTVVPGRLSSPRLSDQQRCSKRASRKRTHGKPFLACHSSNKPLLLLVRRPDLRDLSIFRQSDSLAVEEVSSSSRRLTDERARQTISGQVCPLYPPRAGQRKWRNLWCHKKKVPVEECLRTGCLWSCDHKRLLRLPIPPPPDYHPRW